MTNKVSLREAMLAKGLSPLLFMTILVMMAIGPIVSTDIFLPALPQMANDLGTSQTHIQWFIPIFLLSLGISQPFYGPLSDALGRKGILLFGITLWICTNILLFFTRSFDHWMVLRFIQGVGACAPLTMARAIVGDLFKDEEMVSVFLILGPVIALAPAAAPVAGQFLYTSFGWPSIFVFVILFGCVLLFMVAMFLPESLHDTRRRPFRFSILLRFSWEVIKVERFWYYTSVLCFAFGVLFAYLTESPFLLLQQGLAKNLIGFTYGPMAAFFIVGNLLVRILLRYFQMTFESIIHVGSCISLLGGISVAASLWFYPSYVVLSVGSMCLMAMGNGCVIPVAMTRAITAKSDLSGTASGIFGLSQQASSALAGFMIGIVTAHQLHFAGLYIGSIAIVGFLVYTLWRFRFFLFPQLGVIKKIDDIQGT